MKSREVKLGPKLKVRLNLQQCCSTEVAKRREKVTAAEQLFVLQWW